MKIFVKDNIYSDDLQKTMFMGLFFFLLFCYPLFSFLWRRSYPFLSAETFVIFALLAILSLVLALLLKSVRSQIVGIFSSLLITIVFLVQFNLLLKGVVICLAACLLITSLLKSRFYFLGMPVLAVLILGALIDSFADDGVRNTGGSRSFTDQRLPPVVHIILDSFAGLDGLPGNQSSVAIENEIFGFLNYYNFLVFPRAYSPYKQTGDSLYSALNFENKNETGFGLEVFNRKKHQLKSNAEFDALEKLGYRSRVYQTDYLDFCQSNPDSLDRCWTYSQPNVTTIRYAKSLTTRLKMLVSVLLNQSRLLSDLMISAELLLDLGIAVHDPQVFTMLARDIARQPDGNLFFAHVLLPHGPFAFTSDCAINYETENWARYATTKNELVQSDKVYQARADLYFKQVGCALLSMGRLFEYLKKQEIFERAFIVIHGDHGSMISKYSATIQNLNNLTGEEYRASFSTLFAVKFPHGKFDVDPRALPLSGLLEGVTKAVQKSVIALDADRNLSPLLDIQDDSEPFIYLTGTYPLQRFEINIFED